MPTVPTLRIAHWPHVPGTRAEARVSAWVATGLALEQPLAALPRDAHGRPHLAAALPGYDVNWSHGGEVLLAVLGTGLRVGCDVESATRWPRRPLALAQRHFDADTAAAIAALPDTAQGEALLRHWCLREAVLKAHGRGLAFGLHRLNASWDDDGPRLLACDPALGRAQDWTLQAVDLPGHIAIIAAYPDGR